MPVFGPLYQGEESARAALEALLEALQSRHAGAVDAVLFYGSCLRSGDIYDGLLDLYLICDDYRSAYRSPRLGAANWLLPPNVFYAESTLGEKTLRSKVTVISLADFRRGCSRAWFESYIWGRFSQPVALAFSADDTTRDRVRSCLRRAVITLLDRTLPCAPPNGTISELWERGLVLSYATELRAEGFPARLG